MHTQRQNSCSSKTGHRVFRLLLATMHCAYSSRKSPYVTGVSISAQPVMQVMHVSNERHQAAAAD